MPRILIADDEAPITLALKETVEKLGGDVEVDVSYDGKEAYEKLLEKKYDVALLDIYMPGMNGLDIAKGAIEKGINTNFIIITGKATIEITIKALGIEIEEFITKPFRFDKILASVREVLKKRAA